MKGTSIIELVIVMVFFMSAVPLLVILMSQDSSLDYLEDKSMLSYAADYDTSDQMIDATTLRLNAAQVMYLPIVNDNYCPAPGKVVFLETRQYTNGEVNGVSMANSGERVQHETQLHGDYALVTPYYKTADFTVANYRQSSKKTFDSWNSRSGSTEGVYQYIVNNDAGSTIVKFVSKNGVNANVQAEASRFDAQNNARQYRMYLFQKTLPENATLKNGGMIQVERTWVISSYYPNNTF